MIDTPNANDAEIEASRAPLLHHLMELRDRLWWMVAGIGLGALVSFAFAKKIFLFLVQPFRHAMAQLGRTGAIELVNTDAFGFFMVQMKVALFAGLVLAFPIIAYNAYAFIAPGLYKRERAVALPFLIAAPVMFLAGAAFAYLVAMPFALEFSLKQELNEGGVVVRYLPKVDEYLGLVTTLILAFGAVFQAPVAFGLLARMGMISASWMRKGRRYAILAIAAFSALVTPPDPLSMMIMAVPVYGLYEISIWLVWFIEKARLQAEAKAGEQAA